MNNIEQSLINNTQLPYQQGQVLSQNPNKKDSIKQLSYVATGTGVSLGISKGVDLLVKSSDSYKQSILGKLIGKIDVWTSKNKFAKAIESSINSTKNQITKKITDLAAKNQNYEKIISTFKNGTKIKSMLTREPLIKQLTKQLKENPKNASLITNKIEILKNSNSHLSKLVSKLTLGTGNYIGSGLLSLLIMGPLVGNSIKTAMEAPKGEKLSTFMEDLMGGWIGGYLLMSPAGKVVNGIAGLKNLTITKSSPIWQKGLKTIGKIVGSGQGKTFLKGLPGGILRLAMVLAITAPFTKLFKKASHLVFGKPTPKEEKTNNQAQNLFGQLNNTLQQPNQSIQEQSQLSPQINQQSMQKQNQTYSYIPSPEPAKFENSNSNQIDSLIQKANNAEKQALEQLKNK